MLNKVMLIGRAGRDPEVRYMPDGTAAASLSLATSESWKDANGNKQERTEWHNIVVYGKLAEICGQYLKKGGQVYFGGKIRSRKYTGRDGIEKTAYEIVADEMKLLGGAQESTTAPADNEKAMTAQDYARASGGTAKQPAAQKDVDDDVPF